MKINSIYFERGDEKRSFIFNPNINLIYSKENSKGKTTLLRLILFGLGYNIPATDGIKTFDNFYIEIEYENNNDKYIIKRYQDNVQLYKGQETENFTVPEQLTELHSIIFNIDDIAILNNLLGIFYIDQEKGWTLLNRGIIIGKNRFNIEDFISALSNKDIQDINNELDKIKDEIRKYKYLKSIVEYRKEVIIDEKVNYNKKNDLEIYKQKNLLEMQKNDLIQDINEIDGILKDNDRLIKYLEKLEIYVKISDNENIRVNKLSIDTSEVKN